LKRFLGLSKGRTFRDLFAILGCSLWAIFVNLVNLWLIEPLVIDLAVLGVTLVLLIVVLWLTSIPQRHVRGWITFTVFALLLAQGIAGLTQNSSHRPLVWSIVLAAVLIGLTCWFGKIPLLRVLIPSMVLALANFVVPIQDWPFLPHFTVSFDDQIPLDANAFPTMPLMKSTTSSGGAIVTMQNMGRQSGSFLHQPFSYMEIFGESGRIRVKPATPEVLAHLNVNDVIGTSSPFFTIDWSVHDGHLEARMKSTLSSHDYALMTSTFVSAPTIITSMWGTTLATEAAQWHNALHQLGTTTVQPAFVILGGHLRGTYHNRKVDVPVTATHVVAQGSFTKAGAHEILLEGVNILQVISLDNHPRVISTYHVNPFNPISGNMVIGPIDATNRDVIYVNGAGARILEVGPSGGWHQIYQAPNPNLRFLAAVKFPGERTPEILTDDSSYMRRSSTTVFLTSYTYREGQLIRNWRIYRTDITSATNERFTSTGATQLVVALGQRHIAVLRRHEWPVVPFTASMFGLTIATCWFFRLRERRRTDG
jgi:hypothetical protein